MSFAVSLGHQDGEVAPTYFFRVIAKDLLGGAVERMDPPGDVDEDDSVQGRVDQRAPHGLGARP